MPIFRTRLAVLSAGALLAAGSALAAEPNTLSFPRARDAATVAEWLAARTDMPLQAVVVSGPESVFAVLPSPGLSQVPAGRRVRVVQEVIDPAFTPILGGRSAVIELDVDCAGRRVMRQAFDIYGGSNLGGQVERLGAGRAWSVVEPETAMAAILTAACTPEAAPRPLETVTVARAERPAAPPPAVVEVAAITPPPPPVRPAPVRAAPLPPAPAAPAQPVRVAYGPAPMVNLGEFPSLEAARAAWAGAAAGQPGKVQRIELASGRFRALVDGYGSAAEAEAACAAIRGRGGQCSLR
jgi:hypothetical protein